MAATPKKVVKRNKWEYNKVLQGNYGYGLEDLISMETDSTGYCKDKKERDDFKQNVRLYRENERGIPHRVIFRREKKTR